MEYSQPYLRSADLVPVHYISSRSLHHGHLAESSLIHEVHQPSVTEPTTVGVDSFSSLLVNYSCVWSRILRTAGNAYREYLPINDFFRITEYAGKRLPISQRPALP